MVDEDYSPEKQEVYNRIIAAGLNAIADKVLTPYKSDNLEDPERILLEKFVSQSFREILCCWSYLTPSIQFHIFKAHKEKFETYMKIEAAKEIE